jgi:hypothetical protein
MNANSLESKFALMGARFQVSVAPPQRSSENYAMDIQKDRRGQFFDLRVSEHLRNSLAVNVLQTDKHDRPSASVRPPT